VEGDKNTFALCFLHLAPVAFAYDLQSNKLTLTFHSVLFFYNN
jgi:hypothetical protein